MDNKVVNRDVSAQTFDLRKLQDEWLLTSSYSSCSFLRSNSLTLLSVPGSLMILDPYSLFRKSPPVEDKESCSLAGKIVPSPEVFGSLPLSWSYRIQAEAFLTS
jgi:hypothetical protein